MTEKDDMLSPVPNPTPLGGSVNDKRAQSNHSTLPVAPVDPTRVAVLLNRNARRVTDKTARLIEQLVGRDSLFYSRSLDEAEAFCREIVQRGYGTVVTGGGDGTFIQAVNMIQRYIEESNAWRLQRHQRFGEVQHLIDYPRFAFLRLGTGNGMTPLVGAGKPLDDLRRLVDYAPSRTHHVPLVQSGNERFVFGGMGYDSVLLNDYNWLKRRASNAFTRGIMEGVTGYFIAGLGRTIPRILSGQGRKVEIRVRTVGKAYYVDPRRGDCPLPIEPGEILFEGPVGMAAISTSPFFGYNMKVFPFASMIPGMMQLRLARMGPLTALARLPSIWRGHYRNPAKLLDFLVEEVEIELAKPYPFQHSGDDQGLVSQLHFRRANPNLKLVDLYSPRPVA